MSNSRGKVRSTNVEKRLFSTTNAAKKSEKGNKKKRTFQSTADRGSNGVAESRSWPTHSSAPIDVKRFPVYLKRYKHARWDELLDSSGKATLFQRDKTYSRQEVFGKRCCAYLEKGRFSCAQRLSDSESQMCAAHHEKWTSQFTKTVKTKAVNEGSNAESATVEPESRGKETLSGDKRSDKKEADCAETGVQSSEKKETSGKETQEEPENESCEPTGDTNDFEKFIRPLEARVSPTMPASLSTSVSVVVSAEFVETAKNSMLQLQQALAENQALRNMLADCRSQTSLLVQQLMSIQWMQQQQRQQQQQQQYQSIARPVARRP